MNLPNRACVASSDDWLSDDKAGLLPSALLIWPEVIARSFIIWEVPYESSVCPHDKKKAMFSRSLLA